MSIATQLHLQLPAPQPGAEGGDSLPDRLCALLARRGRPLEVGHVAAQLLRLRGCPERLQRRLVAEIVEGDARLAWLGRDLVGLAPPDWSSTELTQAVFCVVNLETTGGAPGHSKVTEIGAVRIRALEVEERFATLVNPGRPIPPVVTDLTGIDDAMVAASPEIEEALGAFVTFAGQDVLVAHNAPFDLRFLNYERRRLWRALLHPALARHPGARAAAPQRPRPAPRPRHPGGVGGDAGPADPPGAPGRRGHRGGARPAHRDAGRARRRHPRAGRRLRRPRRRPPLVQAGPRRGPADRAGRVRDARPGGQRALRGQGRQPAPPGALVLRAGGQARAADRAGPGAARLASTTRPAARSSPPFCGRTRSSRACGRRATAAGRRVRGSTSGWSPTAAVPGCRWCRGCGRTHAAYFGPLRSQRLTRQAVACLRDLYPIDDDDPAVRATARRRADRPAARRPGRLRRPGAAAGGLGRGGTDPGGPGRGGAIRPGRCSRCSPASPAPGGRPSRCAVLVEPAELEGGAEALLRGRRAWCATRRRCSPGRGQGPAREGLDDARCASRGGGPGRRTRWTRWRSWRTGCAPCARPARPSSWPRGWAEAGVLEGIGRALGALRDLPPPEPPPDD